MASQPSLRSRLASDISSVTAGAGPYIALGTALLPLLGFLYVFVGYDAGLQGRGYLATEISVPSLALIGATALFQSAFVVALVVALPATLVGLILRSRAGPAWIGHWSRGSRRAVAVGFFVPACAVSAFIPGWPASILGSLGALEIVALILWAVLWPESGRFRNLWWLLVVGLVAMTIAAGLAPRGPAASGMYHFIAQSGAAPADGRYAEVARSDTRSYLQPCGRTDVIAVSNSVIGYVDEELPEGPSPGPGPSLLNLVLKQSLPARLGYAPC